MKMKIKVEKNNYFIFDHVSRRKREVVLIKGTLWSFSTARRAMD